MLSIQILQRPFLRWTHVSYSEKAIGMIALAICILSGSTFNAFSKELSGHMSPLFLIFISEALTALFITFSFGLVPTFQTVRNLGRSPILSMFIVGLLAGVLGPLLFFSGIQYTSAINAGFFSRFEIIFLIGLAHIFLQEKVTRVHWIGGVTIFSGILMIILRGFTASIDFQMGDSIIVLSILCYSAAHIIYRSQLKDIHPHIPLLVRALCAMFAFMLILPFTGESVSHVLHSISPNIIPTLIGFALISRFLSSMTFYVAIDRLPMTAVSLTSSLSIISSTLFASLYLHERLYWYHFAGGLLVILGTSLVEILGHKKPDHHVEHRLTQRVL